MKTVSIVFILLSLGLTSTWAQSFAGEDSARYYKSNPNEFDGKAVDIDCTFVTRINGGPQIDGITFFAAHTKDSDNRARGGSIVIAVPEDEADAFMRKYGTTLDISRGATEKVGSKRLRGIFHVLESGRVYIDESGELHPVVVEHSDIALGAIGTGDRGGKRGGLGLKKKL